MSVNGNRTVPVPFPRGPRRSALVRRESGTGTKAANRLFSSGKSIKQLGSQSHFHDSLFSLCSLDVVMTLWNYFVAEALKLLTK